MPGYINKIPNILVRPLSMLSDVITGFMMQNPEFKAYAKHNIFHLKKFFLRKLGIKSLPASKVLTNTEFQTAHVNAGSATSKVA